jgi:hypothetical protein
LGNRTRLGYTVRPSSQKKAAAKKGKGKKGKGGRRMGQNLRDTEEQTIEDRVRETEQ